MFMFLPTIFDWLARFDFMRGMPAVLAVLLAAVIITVARDWRLVLLALAALYAAVGFLYVDILDPRLATVKVLVGLFICLILYITARQVSWGRLPPDIDPDEVIRLEQERRIRLGGWLMPTSMPFRLFLALMVLVVVLTVGRLPAYQLPGLTAQTAHVSLAIYGLISLGFVGLGLTSEPLRAGISLLLLLVGFELFYSGLDQRTTMLTALAATNFLLALMITYLTQARHDLSGLFD